MDITELPLDPRLIRALQEMGFTESTTIQEKAIPLLIEGRDIVASSKTGSGKTAAFGLPILQSVQPQNGLQALILTPTRELCVQVADALQQYGKYMGVRVTMVYGGVAIEPQMHALRTAEIVVATPGRALDHLERRSMDLSRISFFVLDEADKMLEMGFIEDVERIMSTLPPKRQMMLFSATLPHDIEKLVEKYQHDPAHIEGEPMVDNSLLHQVYYELHPADKFSFLLHLIRKNSMGLSMVFCSTRREVDVVATNLRQYGIRALAIHGGHAQNKRQRSLDALKSEDIHVLVATDVAARGIDVKNVQFIYNYDVPKTKDEYVHRVGRTARAGESGEAITLLIQRDHDNMSAVLRDKTLQIESCVPERFERVRMQRVIGAEDEPQGGYGRGGPRRGPPRGGSHRSTHGAPQRSGPSHGGPRHNPRPHSAGHPSGGPRRNFSNRPSGGQH